MITWRDLQIVILYSAHFQISDVQNIEDVYSAALGLIVYNRYRDPNLSDIIISSFTQFTKAMSDVSAFKVWY